MVQLLETRLKTSSYILVWFVITVTRHINLKGSFMKKMFTYLFAISIIGFTAWYNFIALKPIKITQKDIISSYQFTSTQPTKFKLKELNSQSFRITFRSFDGSIVNGQITYPNQDKASYPVLVGVSAMGKNYNRWWLDSFKGKPTVTNVNKIGKAALDAGYAVVAIDARYHGSRKDPDKTLRSIMNDLYFFGDKTSYEEMIVGTVKDYRILLDWLNSQKKIDSNNIIMAGYSMGAQVSLITAAIDNRIKNVVSIVPPFLDDKVSLVAPKNLVSLVNTAKVLLITSDDDENASEDENKFLFNLIPTPNKEHIIFKGNHILPDNYVDTVKDWLVKSNRI